MTLSKSGRGTRPQDTRIVTDAKPFIAPILSYRITKEGIQNHWETVGKQSSTMVETFPRTQTGNRHRKFIKEYTYAKFTEDVLNKSGSLIVDLLIQHCKLREHTR